MKILIIQTAFYGDLILSLPMLKAVKSRFPDYKVDYLCIPKTAPLLNNNPDVNEVIIYDKRGADKGIAGFNRIRRKIKENRYDTVISVQRFLRTTLLASTSGAELTIGFDNSVLSGLYKRKVHYGNKHEILRNLELLKPLGIETNGIIRPDLFPSENDRTEIDRIFNGLNIKPGQKVICAAPGSVWFTKRFPPEKFASIFSMLDERDYIILLTGDSSDRQLCDRIQSLSTNNNIYSYAGKLSIMQSAELIGRSSLLLTNDSAPLHIANAMSTDVIAFFGSTVKDFGFYPYGGRDAVFEVSGLKCRPCTNHGMDYCKTGTFDCMNKISNEDAATKITEMLG